MRSSRYRAFLGAAAAFAAAFVFTAAAYAADPPKITKDDLKAMLGKPDVVVVDVRAKSDWDGSKTKIKGAVRGDPADVKAWMASLPREKTLVFYCA